MTATSRDLARTQENILEVATHHFARAGYAGARVDEIADETSTTKRMIYYCFDHKDGLFTACLEAVYHHIRQFESSLELDALTPKQAVARYVAETLRYHEAHPEAAQLIRSENVLGAPHMEAIKASTEAEGRTIIQTLERVLEKGRAEGTFKASISGLDLHLMVSAVANYRITNRATAAAIFGTELTSPSRLDHDVENYVGLVLAWLTAEPTPFEGLFTSPH